jgi:hypothetical protein
MAEPRGLSLGKSPSAVAAPAYPAPPVADAIAAPAQPAPLYDMKVAGSVAGQQLVPISTQEAGELGKSAGLAVAGIADKITGVARAGDIDEVGKALNSLLITAKKYDPSHLQEGRGRPRLLQGQGAGTEEPVRHRRLPGRPADARDRQPDQSVQGRIGDLETLYDENEARYTRGRQPWPRSGAPHRLDGGQSAGGRSGRQLLGPEARTTGTPPSTTPRSGSTTCGAVQALCQQQGPQIKLMPSNSAALVMKFGEIKTDTIPVAEERLRPLHPEPRDRRRARTSRPRSTISPTRPWRELEEARRHHGQGADVAWRGRPST